MHAQIHVCIIKWNSTQKCLLNLISSVTYNQRWVLSKDKVNGYRIKMHSMKLFLSDIYNERKY